MGPPIDHTGGVKLGSQTGVILATQNEPKFGVSPMVYLHAGFHMRSTGSPTETPMPLALNDLHATRRGDNPNGVHNCQNGKIVHTDLGLAP